MSLEEIALRLHGVGRTGLARCCYSMEWVMADHEWLRNRFISVAPDLYPHLDNLIERDVIYVA